jgi:hypothetical protein
MRTLRITALALTWALPAAAADVPSTVPVSIHVDFDGADRGPIRLPRVDFTGVAPTPHLDLAAARADATQTARSAPAFVYSEGYQTRDKIHHMASYTMLPLFVTEAYLGQHMFNNPATITPAMQTAHRQHRDRSVESRRSAQGSERAWPPHNSCDLDARRRCRLHGHRVHTPEQHDSRRPGDLHR